MSEPLPIVYIRGYAGTQSDVESTVDDPTYGFNTGSTHIRQDQNGNAAPYMFVSPFARLFRDHGYQDVIDGAAQTLPLDVDPNKTIWIFRYYDVTSKTFDRPGGKRLSIEEAALELQAFITQIQDQAVASKQKAGKPDLSRPRVYLIAHSMGGLVVRCLLQKIYPAGEAEKNVAKLFTYGTPHGGINFDVASGLLERLRDFGFNDSDNFGPKRMYQFLTPNPLESVPDGWDPRTINKECFNPDRIFCIVGTNAKDYLVAAGLSKVAVGPQSDGLVQIESAYVRGAHRAYIHRSHSGRYGMVNSEEGYQNLQRFLFGDSKITAFLSSYRLSSSFEGVDADEMSYFVETQISVRGLPILMHDRTLSHFSAELICNYQKHPKIDGPKPKALQDPLPLFSNFLFQGRRDDGTIRYMIFVAIYRQDYKEGFLMFGDHIERLPLWSDRLVLELTPTTIDGQLVNRLNYGRQALTAEKISKDQISSPRAWEGRYTWASQSQQLTVPLERIENAGLPTVWKATLPAGKAQDVLGKEAAITFNAERWD